jgi:hypothetical protein
VEGRREGGAGVQGKKRKKREEKRKNEDVQIDSTKRREKKGEDPHAERR